MPTIVIARRGMGAFAASCLCFSSLTPIALATDTDVPARVLAPVVDRDSVTLTGNTHPLATPESDRGLVDAGLRLERMMLVLQRSPDQDAALVAFNERQQDQSSPDYHHWLTAQEFGQLYGPADADIAAVTRWLQNHGLEIYQINEGKVSIEFSGTVAQVQEAFKLEMHRYLVGGVEHIANDRDPQIPRALTPVVNGVASLNDFRPHSLAVLGKQVERDMRTGAVTTLEPPAPLLPNSTPRGLAFNPNFAYTDESGNPHEDVSPYDFAIIYNSLPLWKENTPVIGTGVKIAIAGGSDIASSDVANFRKAFGLPAKSFTTVHNGKDPGKFDDQVENTLDVEMAGAAAPGASVILVVSAPTSTSYGFELSMQYIVSHETASIMSASYGICELTLGKSGNALYNGIEQQGATEGISIFISAGDQGAAGCDGHQTTPDTIGLAVNGIASTPYVTAVGGTDFTWSFIDKPLTTYWNTQTSSDGASAKGILPEVPWNSTCVNPLLLNIFTDGDGKPFSNTEQLCNAVNGDSTFGGLIGISGGSGGTSTCTTPKGKTISSCSGGYAKPSWQTGTGVPSDGKRDVPDVSLFSSIWTSGGIDGSAILFCFASNGSDSCDYLDADHIVFQEIGGTSAASPYMAGVMALIQQKTGSMQGLANPTFYKLAATESLSACNSATVKNGNSCIFYDIKTGLNAQACETGSSDCTTKTSGDEIGIQNNYSALSGYDRATGLGSINIANLVNKWTSAAPSPTVSVSPSSIAFPDTVVGSTSAAQTVTVKNTGSVAVSIKSVSLTGSGPSDFGLSNSCGTSLSVGDSCKASVTFKPGSTGAKAASLSISDNAGGSPQIVTLTGSGTSSGTSVKLSTTSLSFATQKAGTTSAAQTVTLTNTGSSALKITSILLTGAQADNFVSSKTCTSTLSAGASCKLSLSFNPDSPGGKSAKVSITDNGSGSPQSVALSGTGD